eukprot:1160585-Pelagomonas_calceolata.AAC.1
MHSIGTTQALHPPWKPVGPQSASPSWLSTPLEASWAAEREPLLVHKSRSSDRPLHRSPPEQLNLEAQDCFEEDGLSDEHAYMYARQASPPRQARLQFSGDLWQVLLWFAIAGILHRRSDLILNTVNFWSSMFVSSTHDNRQQTPSSIQLWKCA